MNKKIDLRTKRPIGVNANSVVIAEEVKSVVKGKEQGKSVDKSIVKKEEVATVGKQELVESPLSVKSDFSPNPPLPSCDGCPPLNPPCQPKVDIHLESPLSPDGRHPPFNKGGERGASR